MKKILFLSLLLLSCSQKSKSVDHAVNEIIGQHKDQKFKYVSYQESLDYIKRHLKYHPDKANDLLQYSIQSLKFNHQKISKKSYLKMFNCIKDKAELNPELMDYMGNNAKYYLISKYKNEQKKYSK